MSNGIVRMDSFQLELVADAADVGADAADADAAGAGADVGADVGAGVDVVRIWWLALTELLELVAGLVQFHQTIDRLPNLLNRKTRFFSFMNLFDPKLK